MKKRVYRANHRERYAQSTFISDYIRKKYTTIYDEANQFYKKLHQSHPKKTKLSTCAEYKLWEESLGKDVATMQDSATSIMQDSATSIMQDSATSIMQDSATSIMQDSATSIMQDSITTNFNINIELMNKEEVELTKDAIMLEGIQPSLVKEISPEIVAEIINELNQTPTTQDIFDGDEDEEMNELINSVIEADFNQMTELEKELLMY